MDSPPEVISHPAPVLASSPPAGWVRLDRLRAPQSAIESGPIKNPRMTPMMPVDPYVVQQASFRASLLVASCGFAGSDWEDLQQEMVLDVLRRSPKFDPARGDWRGFVHGVVRNHAAVLIKRERRRTAELHRQYQVNPEYSGVADPMALLHKRPLLAGVDALHLGLDIHRVVDGLPSHLQSLVVLLGQMPVKDVCRRTGKSRSRVYQMTRQIREAFLRAGFSPSPTKRSTEPAK
jgi:RNA polymerase sigma-70 factor (ECF subfamily)